ncbi:MAG: methylenetetrahydrofolate reductase [Faecalibacterium sp.]
MPSPLTVFGALNLNARNVDVELRRAVEKLENGMTGFLTQPVLSEQAVQNLQQARQTLGSEAKILAGILPVVSQRNAIFMENEVNGIHVDAAIIDRFAGLDRAAGEELGIEISVQAAKAALPYADGFYLMTPFNRVAPDGAAHRPPEGRSNKGLTNRTKTLYSFYKCNEKECALFLPFREPEPCCESGTAVRCAVAFEQER